MLRNVLRISLRNLKRHRGFSVINITGLATGMAAFVLIALFIRHEFSYDQHNEHANDVYRVILDAAVGGQEILTASSPAVMATQFQEDFPEVVAATRLDDFNESLITVDNRPYYESGLVLADSSVFDVFTIPFVAGNPATALNKPNTMVLSASTARKYFGDADPIGQRIQYDNRTDYEITGVYEDVPTTSHFRPDLIGSFLTHSRWNDTEWLNNSFFTYIRLAEGTPASQLTDKFPDFLRTYVGPRIEQFAGMPYDDALSNGFKYTWQLERLSDIYLTSQAEDQLGPTGDVRYLYILGVIALFVLVIACINFMNLSTARATGRAREVGVRKTLGSDRAQLIRQFLGESLVLSFLSMVLAFVLVLALLPAFSAVTGSTLAFTPWLIGVVLLVAIGTGLLAGLYPSFVLSAFRPALVLKGSFATSKKGTRLRSALVVFQFSISVVLLVGTAVVYKQLAFIQDQDLGFNQDHLVVVPIETRQAQDNFDTFRNQLLQDTRIVNVASGGLLPGPDRIHNNTGFRGEGMRQEDFFIAGTGQVSPDYVETLDLQIIAGRDFSREMSTDSSGAVISRAAALEMGVSPEEAVGMTVSRLGGGPEGGDIPMTILGVFEDANFESAHMLARPIVLTHYELWQRYAVVRVVPTDMETTLATIEAAWTAWEPGYPFRYHFVDSDYQQFYEQEQRLGNLYTGFTILAIIIACLGLFGLASFVTAMRRKEIGVRKVMGASVPSIVRLLSREFTVLVLVACAIGFPIAWYAMDMWLAEFAYATSMGWFVFVGSGAIALGIAWLTVSWQSIRAATADPVKSLRYE